MSDKFKLTQEQIDKYSEALDIGYSYEDVFNEIAQIAIESIIQDRGKSIQDGWIDVERINKYGKHQHKRGVLGDRYISFDYWRDDKQPLPSAPKQPKK